jgi:diphthamide synthase (EF-2-diphthine--ammonia ligase)
VEIVGLLTSVTRGYDRVSIHGVRRVLLESQAAALQLPLTEILLDPECTNDAYEAAFLDAVIRAQAVHGTIAGIAFGDLFLEDVRQYRERLLASTGLTPVFPLWGEPTGELAARCVTLGIEARLVCVDTTQLAPTFAGRLYDHALLADLPPSVDPCGERGEFHTFVAEAPGFRERVAYTVGETVRRGDRFVYCDLMPGRPNAKHPRRSHRADGGAAPGVAEVLPSR